MLLFIIF